jgi:superfamily II DNA or RNA helicase
MSLNVKKAEIQQAAFEAWNVDRKNTCILHTGLGKTFLMFKCILASDAKQVLILFEASVRESNIKADIVQYKKFYGVDPMKGRKVIYMCYQSAYKTDIRSIFPEGKVFLGLDECHELTGKARWEFVRNSNFTNVDVLAITATLDKESIFEYDFGKSTKYDLINGMFPVCFTYDIEMARQDGTTRDLQIYIYNHRLDNHNRNIIAGTKTQRWNTTEFAQNQHYNNDMRKWMFSRAENKEFVLRSIMSKRSQFLYNLPSKIEECKKLLQVLPGRTLVFANSSKALIELGIPAIVSDNPDYLKDLERFQKGKINQIGSNKILLQGANLKDLDNIIFLSYYGKSKDAVQRAGRARENGGKLGKLVIFVTLGSQEEKWFTSMMEPLQNFKQTPINNILDCL